MNNIAFAQLGRRYQYKYAEILFKENLLFKLYTDLWFPYELNKRFNSKIVKKINIQLFELTIPLPLSPSLVHNDMS